MSETLITDKSTPGHWRVNLNNPPINLIDDRMYDAFYDLVGEIDAEATLEIVLGGDDFDAETAERYGWINRSIPEAALDAFVANFVRRVVSFDKQALSAAKSIINASGLPDPAQLQATQDLFFTTFGWNGFRERAPILRARGIGQPGDFELRLGHHIANLKE